MKVTNLFEVCVDMSVWAADKTDYFSDSWFIVAESYLECCQIIEKFISGFESGHSAEVKSIKLLSQKFICAG